MANKQQRYAPEAPGEIVRLLRSVGGGESRMSREHRPNAILSSRLS